MRYDASHVNLGFPITQKLMSKIGMCIESNLDFI